MSDRKDSDTLTQECLRRFATLVLASGTKQYAKRLNLSTRQINRILAGAQPNPIERVIRCLQASEPAVGDEIVDFICQEMGGHFVRHECLDEAAVNAVRECAEAIAAISDGHVHEMDVKEIRDAIAALSGLIMSLKNARR